MFFSLKINLFENNKNINANGVYFENQYYISFEVEIILCIIFFSLKYCVTYNYIMEKIFNIDIAEDLLIRIFLFC